MRVSYRDYHSAHSYAVSLLWAGAWVECYAVSLLWAWAWVECWWPSVAVFPLLHWKRKTSMFVFRSGSPRGELKTESWSESGVSERKWEWRWLISNSYSLHPFLLSDLSMNALESRSLCPKHTVQLAHCRFWERSQNVWSDHNCGPQLMNFILSSGPSTSGYFLHSLWTLSYLLGLLPLVISFNSGSVRNSECRLCDPSSTSHCVRWWALHTAVIQHDMFTFTMPIRKGQELRDESRETDPRMSPSPSLQQCECKG